MEVKLTIDSGNLGETVVDLFKNLSAEKKEALASDVLAKWLAQPYDIERKAFEEDAKRQALERILASTYSYDKERYGTIEKVANSDEYRKIMQNFKSSKEVMIETITKEVTETYRKQVTEFVKTDPELNKVLQLTLEEVKKDFPAFVHDAMIHWFAQNMNIMSQGIGMALAKSSQAENISQQVHQRMLNGH